MTMKKLDIDEEPEVGEQELAAPEKAHRGRFAFIPGGNELTTELSRKKYISSGMNSA